MKTFSGRKGICMDRIDNYPTHEKDGLKYRSGRVWPFGASIIDNNAIKIVAYTGDPAADDKGVYDTVTLMPRSLMLLVGQSD